LSEAIPPDLAANDLTDPGGIAAAGPCDEGVLAPDRSSAIPPGSCDSLATESGGIASLNHRLMAAIPPGSTSSAAALAGEGRGEGVIPASPRPALSPAKPVKKKKEAAPTRILPPGIKEVVNPDGSKSYFFHRGKDYWRELNEQKERERQARNAAKS